MQSWFKLYTPRYAWGNLNNTYANTYPLRPPSPQRYIRRFITKGRPPLTLACLNNLCIPYTLINVRQQWIRLTTILHKRYWCYFVLQTFLQGVCHSRSEGCPLWMYTQNDTVVVCNLLFSSQSIALVKRKALRVICVSSWMFTRPESW